MLGPGTYNASQFDFFAVTTGTTTPFLAKNSNLADPNPSGDIDSYSIIASGNSFLAQPVAGTNAVQSVAFGGSNTFTLTDTTKIFAGVSSGKVDNTESNAIGFIGGSSVDHHNPAPTQFTPTVGGTIPTFTNPDLGRIYGFNVTVDLVPEPGALSILGIAGLALLRRRRV